MQDVKTVRITDIVGGGLCVSVDDGQKVFDHLAPLIRAGAKVSLSFAGIETVISAFLNAAVGQLYGQFNESVIRELLSVSEISNEDAVLVKRVVDNAKRYFANKEAYNSAWQEEVGDEE